MIDWLTLLDIPCTHDPETIFNGAQVTYDKDGKAYLVIGKYKPITGSFDKTIHIKSDPKGGEGKSIQISGNPSKFFQGHNLFGSNDVQALSKALILKIIELANLCPTDDDLRLIHGGLFRITRADITESWALQSRAQVKTAIRALARYAYATRKGRGDLVEDGTVYWGQKSKYWTLKGYCKGDEIEVKKHTLPENHPYLSALKKHAENMLRMELVLRGKQFKQEGGSLDFVANWREDTASRLYQKFLGRLTIPDYAAIPDDKMSEIPWRLMRAHNDWMQGHDLRTLYSKSALYRIRKQLMEFGVDVMVMRDQQPDEADQSLCMLKPLFQSPPEPIPDWAKGTVCLFDPKADDGVDGAE